MSPYQSMHEGVKEAGQTHRCQPSRSQLPPLLGQELPHRPDAGYGDAVQRAPPCGIGADESAGQKKDAAAKGQPKLHKMEETPNTKAEEKVRARGKPDEEVERRAERIHVGFFFLKLDASVVVVVHMVMSSTMRNSVGHVAARIILQTVSLEQKIHVREQQRWDLRKILSLPHQRLKSLNSLQRRVTAAALEGRRQ